MFSRSSGLRHSLSMGERATSIESMIYLIRRKTKVFLFGIRWINFQNRSSEFVPIVYTSGAENMSRGSVEGNFITHSSPR